MNYWYLVSSLPHLRFGEKPPMGVEDFRKSCVGQFSDDQAEAIHAALDNREPSVGLASAWWNGEVQLSNAVVRVRAKNRSVDSTSFLKMHGGFSGTVEKMVADAFAHSDPSEQEMELDRARWFLADELALANPFSFEAVLGFAVKLRVAERWARMDDQKGQENVESLVLSALEESVDENNP